MTEPIAAPAAVRASASFVGFWIAMMAAMMLPGAAAPTALLFERREPES